MPVRFGEFVLDSDTRDVLGRDPDLSVTLESPSISRRHARVRVAGGVATLEDLGSKNGTYVNGQKVAAPVTLSDRDEIRMGHLKLTFRLVAPSPSTETVASRDG